MKILDEKFKDNKIRYVFQCMLATLAVFIVLMILDAIANAAIIASLGASSFIAFTMPKADVSRARFLVGGYVVGVFSGSLCFGLSVIPAISQILNNQELSRVIFSAAAVGLAIFLMVILDLEHPPAGGVALGLVLNEFSLLSVAVILIGIVSLSVLKAVLKPFLINLL